MTEKSAMHLERPPGFRMSEAMRLGGVRLEIADLNRSVEYYERVLELRVIERTKSRASLGPPGEDVWLVDLNEVAGAREHSHNRRLGLYHFAILLPTRGDLGRFAAHLAHINVYAGQADHFVSEALYLRDPDGLGIEVYADRPRAEWPLIDGKLMMGLGPVDMDRLLEAGGGRRWENAPPGTRIGHVHLHVGDLEEGKNFYHRGLGLDVTASMPSALFLSAGGYHHHLGINTWAGNSPHPRRGDARLLEWTIVLSERDDGRTATSIKAAGYAAAHGDHGTIATDPWGTRFRITS
jgi:catechol 2,3-dioxygenase